MQVFEVKFCLFKYYTYICKITLNSMKIVISSSGIKDKIGRRSAHYIIGNGWFDDMYLPEFDGNCLPVSSSTHLRDCPYRDRIWVQLIGENGEFTDSQIAALKRLLSKLRNLYRNTSIISSRDFFDNDPETFSAEFYNHLNKL